MGHEGTLLCSRLDALVRGGERSLFQKVSTSIAFRFAGVRELCVREMAIQVRHRCVDFFLVFTQSYQDFGVGVEEIFVGFDHQRMV